MGRREFFLYLTRPICQFLGVVELWEVDFVFLAQFHVQTFGKVCTYLGHYFIVHSGPQVGFQVLEVMIL